MLSLSKILKQHIASSTTALTPLVVIDNEIFLSTQSLKFDEKNFEPYLTGLPKIRQSINIREKTFKINTLKLIVDNSHKGERKFSNRYNLMDKYNTEIKVYMYCPGMKTLSQSLLIYNAKIQKVLQSSTKVEFTAEDTVTYNLDKPIDLPKIGDIHLNAPTATKSMPITFGANFKAKAYIVDSTWKPFDQEGGVDYDAVALEHTILSDERGKITYGSKSSEDDTGVATTKLHNDEKSVDWAGEQNHLFIWADDYMHRVSPKLYGSEYSDDRRVDFKGTSTGEISNQTRIEGGDAVILRGTTDTGVTAVDDPDNDQQIFEYNQGLTDAEFAQLSPVIRMGVQCTAIRKPSKVETVGNWVEIPEDEGALPDELTVRKSNPAQTIEDTMGDNNPETGIFYAQFGTDGFPKATFEDVFQASANLESETYGSEPLSPTDIGTRLRQLPAEVFEQTPNSTISDEFANTLSHNMGLSFTFSPIGTYDCFARIKASFFLCSIVNRDGRFSHPSATMTPTLNNSAYSLNGNPSPIRWDVLMNDGVNSGFMGITKNSKNHPTTNLYTYKTPRWNSVCWNTFYKAGGAAIYGTHRIATGINAYNGGSNFEGTGDSPFEPNYNDEVYGFGYTQYASDEDGNLTNPIAFVGHGVSGQIEERVESTNSLSNLNIVIRTKALNDGQNYGYSVDSHVKTNNINVWGWCNAFVLLQNYVMPNILDKDLYTQILTGRAVSLNGTPTQYTNPLGQMANVLGTYSPDTSISYSHPLNGISVASEYLKNDGWFTEDELTGYSYQIFKRLSIKKYIQNICNQSPLVPYVNTSENKIGFNVLRATYPDSEFFNSENKIKEHEILDYKATLTPRLDQIIKEVKVEYNYNPSDEPLSSYPSDGSYYTAEGNIKTEDGTGTLNEYSNEYYNSGQSKIIEARYVKSEITAKKIAENYLKLHANQRIELELKLGLKYLKHEVGDIVYFDKNIGDELLFGFDLTRNNQVVNGQQYFRYFLIIEKTTSLENVTLKLSQLTNTSASNEYGETHYIEEDYVYGCQQPAALNYVPTAQFEDLNSPCQYAYGCNDPNALNYNEEIGMMNDVFNSQNQHWETIDLYLDRLGLDPEGSPVFIEDNSLCLYSSDVGEGVDVSVSSSNTMIPPIVTSGASASDLSEFQVLDNQYYFRVAPELSINSTFMDLLNNDALPNGTWVHQYGGEVQVGDMWDEVYQPSISYQTPAINYEVRYLLWDGEDFELSEENNTDVFNFGLTHTLNGTDITFNLNPFQNLTAQQVIDLFNPQQDGTTAIESLPFIKRVGNDYYIYYRLGRQLNYTLTQEGQDDVDGTTGMQYSKFYVKFSTSDLTYLSGTGNVIQDGGTDITENDYNCMLEIIQLYEEGDVDGLQNACNGQDIVWGNAFNQSTGELVTFQEIDELYISEEEQEEEQTALEQYMAENCFLLHGDQVPTIVVNNNRLDCQNLSTWQGVASDYEIAPNSSPNYHIWEFARQENLMRSWCKPRYQNYSQLVGNNFKGLPLTFQGATPFIIVINRAFFEAIDRFDEYFPNNVLGLNGNVANFLNFYKNLEDIPSDINPLGGDSLAEQLRIWLDPNNPNDSEVYNKFYSFCHFYLSTWWQWDNNDDNYGGINPSLIYFLDGNNDLSNNLYNSQSYFHISPVQFGIIQYDNPFNTGQTFGETGETEFDINVSDVKLNIKDHTNGSPSLNIQDRYLDVFVGTSYTFDLPHIAFNSLMGSAWLQNLSTGELDFLEIGEEIAQNCYSHVAGLNNNNDFKGKYFSIKQTIVDTEDDDDGDGGDDDDGGGLGKNMVKPDYKSLIKTKEDSQDIPQDQ